MKIDNGESLRDRALWICGGIDEERNQFTTDAPNAWRLAKPHYMPSMTKIIYTVPRGFTARAILCKKYETETGNVNDDYTFDITSTKWRTKNRELYTGNTDGYAMFVVMREDGEAFDFDEISVRFYSPKKNEIPAYWTYALDRAEWKILDLRRRFGKNAVEFFYLTDVHWIDNAQRSPALLSELSHRVNVQNVIFGGDMIRRYNPDKACAAREITGFFDWLSDDLRVFTTLGNHDRNYSSGNSNLALRFSEQEAHDLYHMSAYKDFCVTEGDPSHGYYDDAEHKVRMVQFYLSDSMFNMPEDSYVDGALDWVEQKILELDEGWTVLLFTHAYSRGNNPDGSYIVTEKNKQISRRLLGIKKTARANLAFWITGHIHNDLYDVVSDGDVSLQLISVLSDGYCYANAPTAAKMVVGTETEQAIDHVLLDLDRRELHFTRLGAGEDRIYRY